MPSRNRVRLPIILLWCACSCGGGDETAQPQAPADVAGTWSIDETTTGGGVADQVLSHTAVITQDGDSLQITIGGNTLTGSIAGNIISVEEGFLEEACSESDRSIVDLSWSIATDGDSLSGDASWCCPSAAIPCVEGSSTFAGTRIGI